MNETDKNRTQLTQLDPMMERALRAEKLAESNGKLAHSNAIDAMRYMRELNEAIKQRDSLAEALRDIVKSIDPYEMYKTAKRALER